MAPLQIAAGQPRTLAYSQAIRKDIKLLEVDEGLLDELLQSGLHLKGGPSEEAVLCSATKTFAVKTVETTNLLLLVPDEQPAAVEAAVEALGCQDTNVPPPTPPGVLLGLGTQIRKNQAAVRQAPVTAMALVSSHFELVPAAPRLHRLDALLEESRYGAEEAEEGAEAAMQTDDAPSGGSSGLKGGYTEAELLQQVQCSAAELRAGLVEHHALCLDGRYCAVDESYQGMLLELVLLTAVEHGWELGALPGAKVAAALQPHGYDARVTMHCLATYGTRLSTGSPAANSAEAECGTAKASETTAAGMEVEDGQGGSDGSYALDEAAVCLHFARGLLQGQPDWELHEFEQEWQRRVPEGMLPSWEMLRGEVRRYGGGIGAAGLQQPLRIKSFPLSSLPLDAPARFAALFAEQPRWKWEELAPYVQSLRGPGQTAEALLLKYARASQQRPTDPVTYSAR